MSYSENLDLHPVDINKIEKKKILLKTLRDLTFHHHENCMEYKKILDSFSIDLSLIKNSSDYPFLPARIFKEYSLSSVNKEDLIKTMMSSGTTGNNPSKIMLDKKTSARQTKVLAKIINQYIGSKRLPMIIIDNESTIKNRNKFSARSAGIFGFSMFGKDKLFALDDQMNLRVDEVEKFIKKHKDSQILIFGFTYIVWKYFLEYIFVNKISFDLNNGILFHGGGWKKIESEKVSNQKFKSIAKTLLNLSQVHDYYGMVEQTGSIYVECSDGFLHTNLYNDIFIRRPQDFSICEIGEKGMIQSISLIQESYPGHSILTEDEGILYGEDDCKCGQNGKYFKVLGRIEQAEIRGCSDTFSA